MTKMLLVLTIATVFVLGGCKTPDNRPPVPTEQAPPGPQVPVPTTGE